MGNQLLQEALGMQEELSAWRQSLHRIPEIGTSLPKTVEFVTKRLDEMGISYEVYEDCSCVVAVIGNGGKCILLRADMDALPICEQSGVPFASDNGCMHGCGHDMHASALLGAAKLLKAHENELKGTVKLIFQSGEEIFAGARAAVEHGVLENPKVEVAFGMHVFSELDLKTILYGLYPMSAVYGFKITVEGKGTHGSAPEGGVDPITVGAHILLGLQELISREVSALENAALTIGHFEGGSAANIIPQSAILEGTLRTFKPEIREFLIRRIHEITETVAKAYRASTKIEVLSDVPAVVCDPAMMDAACASAKKVDQDLTIAPSFKAMGSEDFSYYSEQVPSAFMCIGAGVEDRSKWQPQHNPKILFNEGELPYGAAIYAQVAMDYLENK
ncbi:MAG: amidohydrolase [Coprococcus sp.]|nr:amidohydrolase [Coprococcus sp.]